MHYKVHAHFCKERSADFLARLTDGSIAQQKPDGSEIVASMQRAVVTASGRVQWSEVCYCSTPLHHERTTVYDKFFEDIQTEEIDRYQDYEGQAFMTCMEQWARTP